MSTPPFSRLFHLLVMSAGWMLGTSPLAAADYTWRDTNPPGTDWQNANVWLRDTAPANWSNGLTSHVYIEEDANISIKPGSFLTMGDLHIAPGRTLALSLGGTLSGTHLRFVINGAGNGHLTTSGSTVSRVILNGSSAYSGLLEIGANTQAGLVNHAGVGATTRFNLNGGTLGVSSTVSDGTVFTIGELQGSGTVTTLYNVGPDGQNASAQEGTRTLRVNQNTSTLYSGALLDSTTPTQRALRFEKAGSGTLTLSNQAHDYTGGTLISSGTLAVTNPGALARYTTDHSVIVQEGATLTAYVGGEGEWTSTSLDTLRAQASFADGATLGLAAHNGSFGYHSLISGGHGLEKLGTHTLTLSGDNTYTGATEIKAGTLILNGDQSGAGGDVFIHTGATLAGTGTIGGDAYISGAHAPGESSAGLQRFTQNLTYTSTARLEWTLMANTTDGRGLLFDAVNTSGHLQVDTGASAHLLFNLSGSTVSWSDAFWDHNRHWEVFATDSTGPGAFHNLTWTGDALGQSLQALRPGAGFEFRTTANGLSLYYHAIPEPSSFLLIGAGLCALAFRAARGRKRASTRSPQPVSRLDPPRLK